MGTRRPCFSSPSTMRGMALAAASLLTVTRTTSLPARARAATCLMVPGMSAVSVLVMDCTITGALLPTRTTPIVVVEVFLRSILAMFKPYFKLGGGKARGMVVLAVNQKARCRNPDRRVAEPSVRLAIDHQQIG